MDQSLFTQSKTRLLWKSKTARSMSSYRSMRWLSKWLSIKSWCILVMLSLCCMKMKILVQLFSQHCLVFLMTRTSVDASNTVDWGEPFVKACYHLEDDGPLALECYEVIDQISVSVTTESIPNVRAVSRHLTKKPPTHPLHEQWVTYARASVQDGIDYFNNQLSSSLKTFGGL